MNNFKHVFATVFLGLTLASCATREVDQDLARIDDANRLHENAKVSLNSGNYQTAIQNLERLDSLYPYGPYAHQSQLSLIYAYYRAADSAKAIATADRFIRQNPRHPNVDYAYYMKGLVNFSSETGVSKELFSAPLSERDASSVRQAFDDFAELIKLFPNSKYAHDARQRMIYLRNRLADYELHVANYYMQRKAYMAAANRAKYVVEHYPKTPSIPNALLVMVTAYDLLNLQELADDSRAVLKLNYPEFARSNLD